MIRSAVAVAGLLGAAGFAAGAQATSYDVASYGLALGVNGTVHDPVITNDTQSEYAGIGEIQLNLVGGGDLLVYCIDVKDWLGPGTFASSNDAAMSTRFGYGTDQLNDVGYLLATHMATATDNTSSAALQLAIWEVLTEATSSNWNVGAGANQGDFYVTDVDSSVVTAANGFLSGLKTSLTDHTATMGSHTLSIIDPGTGNQPQAFLSLRQDDQIQLGVPEPATWGMIVVGFGLLGAALRRRKPEELFA